jgi:hypothetical protein
VRLAFSQIHRQLELMDRKILLDWSIFCVGTVSAIAGILTAPLIWAVTAVGLIAFLLWTFRTARASGHARHRVFRPRAKDLKIGVILFCGLWSAVYLVFKLVDSSVDSAVTTTIPIGLHGEAASATVFSGHGIISTICIAALFIPFRERKMRMRRRKSATET